MVEMTLTMRDDLAQRLAPVRSWLPTILEVSLMKLRTAARDTAMDLCEFLETNPSGEEVLSYHVTEAGQSRLRRLLALNAAGMLDEREQRELDELQQIEHLVVMLKTDVAGELREESLCCQRLLFACATWLRSEHKDGASTVDSPRLSGFTATSLITLCPCSTEAKRSRATSLLPVCGATDTRAPTWAPLTWRRASLTPLLNPRRREGPDHFRFDEGVLHPLTPERRVTVRILRLNDSDRIEELRSLAHLGYDWLS